MPYDTSILHLLLLTIVKIPTGKSRVYLIIYQEYHINDTWP